MQPVDLVILLCFIPALIRGLSKGLLKQLVALVSLFVGAWCAFRFSSLLAGVLADKMGLNHQIVNIIAFIIIVIAAIVALSLLGKLLTKTVELASLGWLNKLLGIVFSFALCTFLICLCIMVFEGLNAQFDLVSPGTLAEAKVYCFFRDIAQWSFPYLKEFAANV